MLAMMLYMFLGLAIVCDEYFEAALEEICRAMNLSDDGVSHSRVYYYLSNFSRAPPFLHGAREVSTEDVTSPHNFVLQLVQS